MPLYSRLHVRQDRHHILYGQICLQVTSHCAERCIALQLLLYLLGAHCGRGPLSAPMLHIHWQVPMALLVAAEESKICQSEGQAAAWSRSGLPSTAVRPLSGSTEGHNGNQRQQKHCQECCGDLPPPCQPGQGLLLEILHAFCVLGADG